MARLRNLLINVSLVIIMLVLVRIKGTLHNVFETFICVRESFFQFHREKKVFYLTRDNVIIVYDILGQTFAKVDENTLSSYEKVILT